MKINIDELSEAELIEPQTGTLTRFNRKSVTVIADNGGHWNVAPTLIELTQPGTSEEAAETPQLKLLK